MHLCFFCRVTDPAILERNEFYAIDLRILRELGHRVTICTTPWRIPQADAYVVWWWTWAFCPVIRAMLPRRPVIVLGTFDHVLSDGTLEKFSRRPWLHRKLIQFALKHADANVVVSRDQEVYLRGNFTVNGLHYSPHVIDTDLYAPSLKPRAKFFLTFCWMNGENPHRKCVAEAIRAVASVHQDFPDYRFVICGERGNSYGELANLTSNLKANSYIEFAGVVSRERKIELMQECSIYLQPTRAEGFGVAILEAMSCGAAVVTSPVGAVPEVGGDAVCMVDGTDPDDIGSGIRRLLSDEKARNELGQTARTRAVREFSYARRYRDFAQIIEQVTAGNSRQAA